MMHSVLAVVAWNWTRLRSILGGPEVKMVLVEARILASFSRPPQLLFGLPISPDTA
jgi:hypothetical protein